MKISAKNRNCEEIRNETFIYLDGTLSFSEKARIETHLTTCDSCRKVYAGILAANDLIEADKNIPADPWFYTRLKARMQQESAIPAEYTPAGLQKIFITALVAASFGLGIIFGTGIQTNIEKNRSVSSSRNVNLQFYANDNMINDLNTDQTENILILK